MTGGEDAEDVTSAGRRRRVLTGLAVLAVMVALGLMLGLATFGRELEPALLMDRIRGLGGWGQAAVVGLMVLHAFVPFPAEVLALCAGALYGTLWGTALIWSGAMLGAALSFGLARWLGRPFVEAMLASRHRARLDRWSADEGAVTLLVVRLIPVIAFNLINYAAGLTRVGWGTFLWTTAVGILPLTVAMVWMGAAMVELSWPWLLGISAAAIVLVVAGHLWARRRGWYGP